MRERNTYSRQCGRDGDHGIALARAIKPFLLVAAATLVSAQLFAATNSDADTRLEEITVTASDLSAGINGIGSVSNLDADELELIRPSHINETLVRIPGVWVSRGSGQEHLTAIRSGVLTGPGACGEFLYLEDGVPIRPAGFCNVNNLFEINHEQATGIEVLRGPAGSSFGGNALHGVINVRQDGGIGNGLSIEGGPFDYYQVRGGLEVAVGEHKLQAKALSTSTNGFRDNTGFGQQKLLLRHAMAVRGWQLDTSFSATLLNQETGGFVLGLDAFEDSELRRSNPNPEAFRDAWSLRLVSNLSRELNNGLTLNLKPYVRRSGLRFLQHFLPGQPLEENDQTSTGLIASVARTLDSGWNYSVGGQVEYLRGALREDQDGPTEGSAFLQATRPEGLHYDYEVDSVLGAAFYNIAGPLTERLSLVHSARVETLNYDYTNLTLTGNTREDGTECGFGGCLYTRPASREDRFTNVAARLGVNYRFSDQAQAYASISTGFRPPQATELYRLQNGQETADLNSEDLRSIELGVSVGHLKVSLYDETTSDLIFRDSEGFNLSNGRTRSQGVEIEWQRSFGARHSVDAVVSYGRHKYDFTVDAALFEQIEDGNDIDTAPRWLGSARWLYSPTNALTSELELVGVGQHFIDAANSAEYEGHVLLNWRGSYQIRDNLEVFGRLLNILDERYAERADFAFGGFRYFPGQPRQLYLGVKYTPGN